MALHDRLSQDIRAEHSRNLGETGDIEIIQNVRDSHGTCHFARDSLVSFSK